MEGINMTSCPFCKIVAGEIVSYNIYENDQVLAFLDIKPHARGHTVVIPKVHQVLAEDLPERIYLALMKSVREVMRLLKGKLGADGFNVGWNDGSSAGQVVPHLHLHIFPRYNGDGGGSMHSIINNSGDRSVEKVARLLI